jgi:O-antigen ligase
VLPFGDRPAGFVERAAPWTDRTLGALIAALPAAAVVLFGDVEEAHALPIAAAALTMGAVALGARAWRGARPLPLSRVTLPVLLLATVPALQLVPLPADIPALVAPGLRRLGVDHVRTLSVYPWATMLALVRWTSYAAFLIAALEVLQRPGALPAALSVAALLGVAEAVYGVGNLMLGNERVLWLERYACYGDATGTLINSNHFATVLELCLPALLARRWLARRLPAEEGAMTAVFLAGATAMGLAIVFSHSRGGLLALVSGLMVSVVLLRGGRGGRGGRLLVGAVGLLVLFYGANVGFERVVERFGALPEEVEYGRRPGLWSDTLTLIRDFPLTGAGAGAYESIFPAYRRLVTDPAAYAHAHQDYLELAAEGGAVAVGLAMLSAWGFVTTIRAGLARAAGRRHVALALLAGGLVAALMHAAVDFPLHIPGVVYLLLLLAAAAATIAVGDHGHAAP